MKLLDKYFSIQQEIYEYFGYEETWHVCPIDDEIHCYWNIFDNEVHFADSMKSFCDDNKCFCAFVKKVYKGKDYTMIVTDTMTDGNIFLSIFDNKKQVSFRDPK